MAALNEQKSEATARRIVQIAGAGRPSLGRVLDVGCGSGQILLAAASQATSLAGIDVSEDFLQGASRLVPAADLKIGSIERTVPFEGRAFDTIFLCDVIEHLHNPIDALINLNRALAAGGTVIVTTPNANAAMRWVLGKRWFGLADESHVLFFSAFTLKHALAKTGFNAVSVRTLGGTGSRIADLAMEVCASGGTLLSVARKR